MVKVSLDKVDGKFEFTFRMDSATNRALSAAVAVFMSAPDHVAQHILNDADADIEKYKDLLDSVSDEVLKGVGAYIDSVGGTYEELAAAVREDINA